jgi:hypothetical protein
MQSFKCIYYIGCHDISCIIFVRQASQTQRRCEIFVLNLEKFYVVQILIYIFIYLFIMVLQPFFFFGLGCFFSFLIVCTVGTTPLTRDHPVARPLSTDRTTQTQNKHTQITKPQVRF